MKNIYILLLLNLLFFQQPINAQEIAYFSLQLDEHYISKPVSVVLPNSDKLNFNDKDIALYEITNQQEVYVDSQLEWGTKPILWFIPDKKLGFNAERNFVIKLTDKVKINKEIVQRNNEVNQRTEDKNKRAKDINQITQHINQRAKLKESFRLTKSDGNITIYKNNTPVLSYRYNDMYPPEGVDSLFKRSGFIHPLYSPNGQVLTRVQAPDHYHHYGIWGPWTLTHIDDREVDFWNLAKGEGTVEFVSFLSEVTGDIYSGFKVLQNHIDFNNGAGNQIALNEMLEVRVWNIDDNVWIIDYTSTINTPLANGVLFDAYRYGGGIGFRATEQWHKDNSTILTSEGKSRVDADGSRARWCIINGATDVNEKQSGILFMSNPSNRQHPEPMRVWPMDANEGRGDIFFEFTPIRYEPWHIMPGQDYKLSYRMVVFDGEMSKETAESYFKSYANSPKIKIEFSN